jgi:hypothetical protein
MGSPQPIIVFNTATGQVLQRFIPTFMRGTESATSKAGSFTGIAYSADGKNLFFSQDDNHVVIANVDPQTGLLTNGQSVTLPGPPADSRHYHNARSINPGGIAVSGDGKRAYVALNVTNMLGVIDLTASPAKLVAQIPVGNAPNSVVIHGKYAYVSNEGGRPATSEDFTNNSDGTPIVADRKDAFAITGTVSVVEMAEGEAVRNAFRHAQARDIEVEITYNAGSCRLRVRDDGKGIDPEIVAEGRAGHYGVPGMRERAKRIGGKLDVSTETGAGTEVELSIPGSIAYGTSPGRTIFRPFRKKMVKS